MFESEALKDALLSAHNKHIVYLEIRSAYIEISEAYVQIRMKLDELCEKYTGKKLFKKLSHIYNDPKFIPVNFSLPLFLGDGSVLTLKDYMTNPVPKNKYDSKVYSFYINNTCVYAHLENERHFKNEKRFELFPITTVAEQIEVNDILNDYQNQIDSINFKIKDQFFKYLLQQKELRSKRKELKKLYAQKKEEGSCLYKNGLLQEEVANDIFEKFGILQNKYKKMPYKAFKMEKDPLPFKRQKKLSEAEEIEFLKLYEAKLDAEIEKIINFNILEDDSYIAYEAFINGIDKESVFTQREHFVSVYKQWFRCSVHVYFKQFLINRQTYHQARAEFKMDNAVFFKNIIGLGTYHADRYSVEGANADLVADGLSRKFSKIESKVEKDLAKDIKMINEYWNMFNFDAPY